MTPKQRMLAAIKGEAIDKLPWAPRLDLWYRANKSAGTLPRKYRKATLQELVDDLGYGAHAIMPDFKDVRSVADEADRALGIYNLHMMPYRTILEGVERTITETQDEIIVEYRTPAGSVRTVTRYDETMRQAGITIGHITEHAIKRAEDFKTLGYIFRNALVEPNYEGCLCYVSKVGERGLASAFLGGAASPMHLIQRELMPLDEFFYALIDRSDELLRLAEDMNHYWQSMLSTAFEAPAEVFLLGSNYDRALTYPPFFAEHIVPTLKHAAAELHKRGKYLLCHTDGENNGLLQHYLDAGFDIADSICPKPMTELDLAEIRKAFGGRITIMGGVPSVALMKDSMRDAEFSEFMDQLFLQLGAGDHHILGVSDTMPPGADFARLIEIGRRVEAFGPVAAVPVRRNCAPS